MTHQPPTQWQRLEAEYATATPERREHIDQLLDESNNFHVVYHEGIMDRVKATLEDQTIGRE